ncbi:MAG: phosphoribosylamine--glycine ligase [Alphaproteobacteria bacterium]
MKVLVLGSGGREHALAWRLKRCPSVEQVIGAPGNPGMAREGLCDPIDPADSRAVVACARRHRADLVVVGPEVPLIQGVADALRAAAIPVVGPSASAARLEGSKAFTKDLCRRFGIPTAASMRFSNKARALDYVDVQPLPVVIKADGLAAGKGVIIAATRAEARAAVSDMLDGRFGAASDAIVIEAFLRGEEVSYFALTDGRAILPLGAAQDHKRVGNDDTGPNTGGMGAYSPAPIFDAALEQETLRRIIQPTVEGMARIDAPYEGILYAGLMITDDGPKLIEYNVRFGDPETQALMLRAEGDLAQVLALAAAHRLEEASLSWSASAAITVVMAADGYPGAYAKGTEIRNLEAAEAVDGVTVFHAGTRTEHGTLFAVGGRVLNVSAIGASLAEARARAYQAVAQIDWPAGFCRSDIGWRALNDRLAASDL